ncbi:MAG: citrate lyase holo-[acyl-carrier protein] synthase [Synergistaceae bacterium]|nr:citrate lyase holo-[acyl-carrier protein] synthase [Synergistaceae bacterium]
MKRALEELLSGRDERAAWQRARLSRGGTFICQIALNIPGCPKRLPGDLAVIKKCRDALLAHTGARPVDERYLENGAGACWQGAFDASSFDAAHFKRVAVEAENSFESGRILDIDVITAQGALSRTAMGLPERRCLLCGESAKLCARLGSHKKSELREIAVRLIKSAAAGR